MKSILSVYAFFLCFGFSCSAQKMVLYPSEAAKLQENQKQFVGKPLRDMLAQIKPPIKFVYGNPDNKWGQTTGGTSMTFYFVDSEEYKNTQRAVGIRVTFKLEPDNKRKSIPKKGLTTWGDEQLRDYGDMIILKIYVSGNP